MLNHRSDYVYQPYFCEENIWQLAAEISKDDCRFPVCVLFFINSQHSVLMAHQVALGPNQTGCWDYHVVLWLPQQNCIVDFDSSIGFQTGTSEYFSRSFPGQEFADSDYLPSVRIIKGSDYLEFFCSDRSHMIDSAGHPMAPFPSWPPMACQSNSLRLADLREIRFADQRVKDQSISEFLGATKSETE